MSECLIAGLFILTEECKCLSQRFGFVFCCAAVGLAGTRNEKTKIDQRRVNLLSDLPVGLHARDVVLMQACVCQDHLFVEVVLSVRMRKTVPHVLKETAFVWQLWVQ
jgi:hypothetical protein